MGGPGIIAPTAPSVKAPCAAGSNFQCSKGRILPWQLHRIWRPCMIFARPYGRVSNPPVQCALLALPLQRPIGREIVGATASPQAIGRCIGRRPPSPVPPTSHLLAMPRPLWSPSLPRMRERRRGRQFRARHSHKKQGKVAPRAGNALPLQRPIGREIVGALPLAQQAQQLGFVDEGDAQLLGLGQLGAGALTG